jgi:hypothetical protein
MREFMKLHPPSPPFPPLSHHPLILLSGLQLQRCNFSESIPSQPAVPMLRQQQSLIGLIWADSPPPPSEHALALLPVARAVSAGSERTPNLICGEKNSKSPPSWTLLIATHHILDNERSRHVPFWERMPPEIVDLFFADVAAKHPNNSMLLSLAREFGIIESTLLGPVAAMVTGSRWHRI